MAVRRFLAGAEDRKWDRLRGAEKEDEARRGVKNAAAVDWNGFRAHFGQDRSGRCAGAMKMTSVWPNMRCPIAGLDCEPGPEQR